MHPLIINSNNKGDIASSKNSIYHAHTKHIDIRHHFFHEKVDSGMVSIEFCGTEEMVMDVLMKGLAKQKHCSFMVGLGIRKI